MRFVERCILATRSPDLSANRTFPCGSKYFTIPLVKPQSHESFSLTLRWPGISCRYGNDIKSNGCHQQALTISMLIPLGLYVDSVLLFLNVLANASLLPRTDKHASADQSRGVALLSQHPSSRGSHKRHHISFRAADVMRKRNDEAIDDLWIRRINILTSSIPITPAALCLDRFYNSILTNAWAPWSSLPRQGNLVMTLGRLQLTMTVVLDSGIPQGIPWAFVRNFAQNMLAMTAMGFTGTYHMYFMRHDLLPFNPHLPNLGVDVRLRILWDH